MSYSGQELIEQEKCKLVYSTFFDGVQCFDASKGRLQLATPDYEFNSYDSSTKTFTTKSFSVSPVTPTDIDNLNKPLIYMNVNIDIAGLKVILKTGDYTKTRIIPIYYLDDCNSLQGTNDLEICITAFQEQIVTNVSFTEGSIELINNNVFKYIDANGIAKLYRLMDINKNIVYFDTNTTVSQRHYFPQAYFIEELSAKFERAIIYNYKYNEVSTIRALYPCGSVLNDEDYLNFDTIVATLFTTDISYKNETNNEWEFNITIYDDNYIFLNNQLSISKLFLNKDTGAYSTREYTFEFFDKYDNEINLETAVNVDDRFTQQLGEANCSGYFKIYMSDIYQENRKINNYNFPVCESSIYDFDTCECRTIDTCLSKSVYPCETCDPETGELTSNCQSDEKCTVFGCKSNIVATACVCSDQTFGIDKFPNVQAYFDTAVCVPESYDYYKLYTNGDIIAGMGKIYQSARYNFPELRIANIYDYIEPKKYKYNDVERTINVIPFILLEYLNIEYGELETIIDNGYVVISQDEAITICPGLTGITIDWFSHTASPSGPFVTYGYPCNYSKVSIQFTKEGLVKTRYYFISSGVTFIYPKVLNYDSVTNDTTIQVAYNSYCNKVKFLGSDEAYTYGRYLDEIPGSGSLYITM